MKEKILKKMTMVTDWVVFLSATATVAIVGYEGLTMMNYQTALFLPVILMDYSFILSVLLHFIRRKEKKIYFYITIVNLLLIVAAYAMKFAGMSYAPWTLLFWDMYLMLYYGYRVIKGDQLIMESEEL